MGKIFKALLERRVFQILGVYLGIAFALFEFTGMATERYGFPDHLIDQVLTAVLTMLPSVLLVAWFHGAPGRDEWQRVEKIVVPVNLLVSAWLVLSIDAVPTLTPAAAAAAPEVRTASTEDGELFTLEVADPDLVQRVAIFFLSPGPLDVDDEWMNYAVPVLISRTLDRDPFIVASSFFEHYGFGRLFWRMTRAGYVDGLGGDVSLLRDIANDYHHRYFTTGTLHQDGEGLRLELELYGTDPLGLLGSMSIVGSGLYDVAADASDQLRGLLVEQADRSGTVQYVPVREVLSDNPVAVKAFVEGKNRWLLEQDLEGALAALKEATEIDRNFAAGFLELANVYIELGRYQDALDTLAETTRLSHRLTNIERIVIKANDYRLRGEVEKAIGVYRMWTELEPDYYVAHNILAGNLVWSGNRIDEAIASYRRSLDLMPNQDWIVNRLGDLYRVQGDLDSAITMFERYHQIRPDDSAPLVTLGDIKIQQGQLDEAERYYQMASLAEDQNVTPVVKLAEVAARGGDYEGAFTTLAQADRMAGAVRQELVVNRLRMRLLDMLGRPREALTELKRQLELATRAESPLDGVISQLRNIHLYALANEYQEANGIIAQLKEQMEPPLDFVPSIGAMVLALYQDDLETGEFHRLRIARAIEESQRLDMIHLDYFANGYILRESGDVERGRDQLMKARDAYLGSIQQTVSTSERDFEQIVLELARTEIQLGLFDEAIASLDALLSPWPAHPEANLVAAQAQAAAGESEAARRFVNVALNHWADAEDDFDQKAQALQLVADLP